MKKTILITGSGGYLGQVVTRDLIKSRKYNVHLVFEDINNEDSLNQHLLSLANVDTVLHLAALNPSYTGNEQDMIQTNYIATKNLASFYKDAHFIFLSTECVFDSDPGTPRNIGDPRIPKTIYGKSKVLAENFLLEKCDSNNISILRTSMLYGYDDSKRKNFLRFLHEHLKNKIEVEVYTDVYTHPTHVSDLSAFILNAVAHRSTGIVHACAEDYVNRYELGKMFCDSHGYSRDLLIPTTQPLAGRLPRQLNLEPSDIFTKQTKFTLESGIKTSLEGLRFN